MRTTLYADSKQIDEWRAICEAYAKMADAELIFVNETSCGVMYNDTSFCHIYIDEMADYVKALKGE